MTDPSTTLKLIGPDSVNVSTAGNPSVATLQFTVANISWSSPVTLGHATLLVPVSTGGTNITSGAMTPVTNTPGWTFASETSSPRPGYVAFALLPTDGVGTLAAGGSVGFELTGVTVDDTPTPAAATLPFAAATTSLGRWQTQAVIELNPANTVPFIARAAAWPTTIQQGQPTVLSWTATGAAYCEVTDDQDNVLGTNLATQGTLATLSDTPVQGNSPSKTAANGSTYYTRGYTLTANSAGVDDPDQRQLSVDVGLPTIIKFAVTPLKLGEPVVVSWTLANLDATSGRVTLTIAPQDGTTSQTLAVTLGIPDRNGLFSGSATVTPTPLPTTIYTLTVHSGYGAFATQALTMTSSLSPGANFTSNIPGLAPAQAPALASFDDKLWCVCENGGGPACTQDGINWTQPSPPLGMFFPWTLLTADFGQGEVLCVDGLDRSNIEFVAWTRDGTTWQRMAPPPMMGARAWAAATAGIVVCGGQVWSNKAGAGWTQIGSSFPQGSFANVAALYDGKLYTVPLTNPEGTATAYSSADGGATWQAQAAPIPLAVGVGCALQAAGDELWLLGAGTNQAQVLALDQAGSWNTMSWNVPAASALLATATHRGHLWIVASTSGPSAGVALYVLNQVLPGTVFTLTPVQSDAAAVDASAGRP